LTLGRYNYYMIVCLDIDGTMLTNPKFFEAFFKAMQGAGHKVGILSYRPIEEKEKIISVLESDGIKPDFVILKPDSLKNMSPGIYKGTVCSEGKVDALFDDFDDLNPEMIKDFLSVNKTTIPFTSLKPLTE